MRLLITAFDAFGNEKENISEIVLLSLNDKIHNIELVKHTIKTIFNEDNIKTLINNIKPDYLIMLGEAQNRKTISLEKVAINYVNARIPDNNNFSLKDQLIINNAPLAYFTPFDLQKIKSSIDNQLIEISYTAGTFVCNYTYYIALNHIETSNFKTKGLFIHLPKFGIEKENLVTFVTNIIKNLDN
ncbi:pyroglutamyl-peptidase I [Haploplasma axanthum]|uniref:Pyrrolidone-carboxylate peptidase n=1 Tax=Haploplasma axanthum TaxID=29552 RepID=A0A449BBZ0_HAPAX|nr:pyroglutamyl-peptidase I [Haploplasma axanthum]VEU79964.1 Pyrrolidone-carboxylate peptidase [Haploplasma axanthum]